MCVREQEKQKPTLCREERKNKIIQWNFIRLIIWAFFLKNTYGFKQQQKKKKKKIFPQQM